MSLVKVVANDSSYCSNFFYFNEISKMRVLGPKNCYFLLCFKLWTKFTVFWPQHPHFCDVPGHFAVDIVHSDPRSGRHCSQNRRRRPPSSRPLTLLQLYNIVVNWSSSQHSFQNLKKLGLKDTNILSSAKKFNISEKHYNDKIKVSLLFEL